MIKRYRSLLALAVVPLLFMGCEDDYSFTEPIRIFTVSPVFTGIDEGTTVQLRASDASGNPIAVNWTSDNTAVATVNANGLVTATGAGITSIIARHPSDANQIASSSITVNRLVGIALAKGVPVTGLGGPTGSQSLYRIFVPAGTTQLKINLSGGTGDADIYVRRGTPPTTSAATCWSFNAGNTEECIINNPQSGTWYILIDVWTTYAGASLVATYTP